MHRLEKFETPAGTLPINFWPQLRAWIAKIFGTEAASGSSNNQSGSGSQQSGQSGQQSTTNTNTSEQNRAGGVGITTNKNGTSGQNDSTTGTGSEQNTSEGGGGGGDQGTSQNGEGGQNGQQNGSGQGGGGGINLSKFGGSPGASWTSGFKALGNLAQIAAPFVSKKDIENPTGLSDMMAIGSGLMSFGGVGTALGAAYTGAAVVGEALNMNQQKLSKAQADAMDISKMGRIVQNITSWVPFSGAFSGKTNTAYKSDAIDQAQGALGDSVNMVNTAYSMGSKNFGFFNGKANPYINSGNQVNTLITEKVEENKAYKQNTAVQDYSQQQFNKVMGITPGAIGVKNGAKLLTKNELQRIYSKGITRFQNGGSILIPDGSLHAHKNHIEDSNPELAEDLTKKGIPVIITDENSEVEQVAEIEKEEIILEKSLTDKIEDLRKEGTEEAMIEAGKIIVDTLFNNCDDNADLVKGVE